MDGREVRDYVRVMLWRLYFRDIRSFFFLDIKKDMDKGMGVFGFIFFICFL